MRTLLLIFFCDLACGSTYAQNVGDISFDRRTDDPKFQLCDSNHIWQGYHLKTKQDETSLMVDREFHSKFKSNDAWKNQNGIIRIRFIVNCSGAADRFRLLQLTLDLKPKEFNNDLQRQVLSIAKSIQWPSRRNRQQTVDYYHYFSVRIVNGQLADVVQ